MDLLQFRGTLALVGQGVAAIADASIASTKSGEPDSLSALIGTETPYHITLATKAELANTPSTRRDISNLQVDTRSIFPIGIGADRETGTYFVVIIWVAGQQLRKQLGLPPKDFHITLSRHDNHGVDKGVDSLLPGEFPPSPSIDALDHLVLTLFLFHRDEKARSFCLKLIHAYPTSERGFLRLADGALRQGQHKLAMLSYAGASHRTSDTRTQQYCVKNMFTCSTQTEWGCVFCEHELAQIPRDLMKVLLVPWMPELRSLISETATVPVLCLDARIHMAIPPRPGNSLASDNFVKLPRFFRWLIPFHIALMSTPRHASDIAALSGPYIGIRHVLTLTEESPLDKSWFAQHGIKNTFLPIPNFDPPSIEQMQLIIRLLNNEDNTPMLIHCGGGKGRAGTVAACYLVAYGFAKPQPDRTQPAMTAREAIDALRAIRPGSIETLQQEAFVAKWCSTIWKTQVILPELPPEPLDCALEIEGSLDAQADFLMLVGLPGSGKSWFSKALLVRDPRIWTHISQDESGSRSSCESAIGRTKGRVLLDRCNVSPADRKLWLELASSATTHPVAVWFDYDRELCISRAQNRSDHPTLPPGSRVCNAVDQMQKAFVRPDLKEGFKAIVVVRSFAAAQELVTRLSPAVTFFKFPRIPHLLNLGGATSDDIVLNAPVLPTAGNVVITEKVDGANMGFSLSPYRTTIMVQNRSNYVNPSTHEQFKRLGLWTEHHGKELRRILHDEHFAQRYILFGEWLTATHSIPYTRLPDRFLAFDLYDRSTNTWADRKTLSAVLSSTSIHMVPVIHEGQCPSEMELRSMVQLQSKYYDGRVEGLFVKVENHGRVLSRAKVVRGDFIAGNDHWNKGKLQLNGIASEEGSS
ncbi:hypothetical protein PLICRDRAFT_420648 [Plicaturopsis crispa FD-325 SS-3]|nr:hypothetical protein PLICRDRAFT_420648 [Plicaturopsis crispa FD-325 SS-3]